MKVVSGVDGLEVTAIGFKVFPEAVSDWIQIVTDTNQISHIHSYCPLNFLILFLIPSLVYIFRYHLLIFL